jgi:hypothetical protein
MSIASSAQPANADPSISFTKAGDRKDFMREKGQARSPIFFKFEISSNLTVAKSRQS